MNYQETLDFLFSQLPMYQRLGNQAIKKDLKNTQLLLNVLGNPQNEVQTVHVAGTNGKGTVSHMLSAIFQCAELKTGLYTSPHYSDLRERFKINGILIDPDYIVHFVSENREIIRKISPSFFEMTVAMAFSYFREMKCDVAVIETGLGGRLDSTNVIRPILSIITHISLDHQDMLGSSIYEIAIEKAGIIKRDIPVIIGRYQSACDHVFLKTASELSSSISFASLNWKIDKLQQKILHRKKSLEYALSSLPNQSPFFWENATCVVEAVESIKTIKSMERAVLDKSIVQNALERFPTLSNYIGRWQIMGEDPRILADSAHNEDALRKVMCRLKEENWPGLHLILGFVEGKDIEKIIPHLPKNAKYYIVRPDIPRGMDISKIDLYMAQAKLDFVTAGSVEMGIRMARSQAKTEELIYIGGSSFVVGEAIEFFRHLESTAAM